jgi:iron complex transport system substrate-binding protein
MPHGRLGLALVTLLAVLAAPTGAAVAGPAGGTHAADAGGSVAPTVGGGGERIARADCTFPFEATDATGTTVTLAADPQRVVTLLPSAAQTMWEIGASEEVVGVSSFAAYLDGASEKATIASGEGVNVERIVGLEPDLVLAPNATNPRWASQIRQLREANVPVFVFEAATSLEFVVEKTRLTGRLTGNCAGANATATNVTERLDRIERAVEGQERPRALYYSYGFAAGNGSFIGDVLTTAGLDNVATRPFFYNISQESVVDLDPEWLVLSNAAPTPRSAAFNSTTAIREGRVIRVDGNLVSQPAPRVVTVAETIVAEVHPEAWEATQQTTTTTTATTATTATSTTTTTTATTTTATEATTDTAAATTTTGEGGPGFAVVAALVAALSVALLAARRS